MVARVARRFICLADWKILGGARACRPRPSEPIAGGVVRRGKCTTPDPAPRAVAPVIGVTLVPLMVQPDRRIPVSRGEDAGPQKIR